MKYFTIDVEKEENQNELRSGLVDTRGEKHREEAFDRRHFPCGALESAATRQDVEAAETDGMKTQVITDDKQLFVREVLDKNIEESHLEEINESAEKCHEPENHDEFAWNNVNNCELDPTQLREAGKAEVEYLQKIEVYKKGTCPGRDGTLADQGRVT